jgi:predicted esterase
VHHHHLARLALAVACATAALPAFANVALAQAPVSVVSLGVAHASLRNSARPAGELKTRIDSLDALIAAASRRGHTGEMRRLYAHAGALLRNRPWTPESEYAASLVLRTDRQVVDPLRTWTVRLEQIFAPGLTLERAPVARVTLLQRAAGSAPGAAPAVVRDLGTFDGVPRDLRDTPFAFESDLRGLADGAYTLSVAVMDSARTLGTATLPVVVRNGLEALAARLEQAAGKVPEPVRSDLLFPVDRLRQVNLGRLELRTFNATRDFAAAESLLVAVNARRDPWAGRKGDLKRHYRLEAAGEIMPYRLYIPSSYDPRRKAPLIVALHGLGGTEDAFFDQSYGEALPKLAEQRGYIVVAPLGYRVDGGYGVALPGADPSPAGVRARALSEQDVMEVLKLVRAQYTIDETRTFLMGHSMGAIGTWALAAKYPEPWAGLGLFAGFGAPSIAPRISHIPQFVVHGDADPTVSVVGSRGMVTALKDAGAAVTYLEIAGGNHSNVVAPNLPAMFDLFDTITKRPSNQP